MLLEEFRILRLEEAKDLPLPMRYTELSSGIDLYANVSGEIKIKSKEVAIIPTGIKLIIPYDYEVQIRPRSGLAANHGITVLNSPGTIDADYRGEIKVILINHGKKSHVVKRGNKIAQMVLCPISRISPTEISAEEFRNYITTRGSNGFGSTGM
jgi:dUTP pyrophosphatase